MISQQHDCYLQPKNNKQAKDFPLSPKIFCFNFHKIQMFLKCFCLPKSKLNYGALAMTIRASVRQSKWEGPHLCIELDDETNLHSHYVALRNVRSTGIALKAVQGYNKKLGCSYWYFCSQINILKVLVSYIGVLHNFGFGKVSPAKQQ